MKLRMFGGLLVETSPREIEQIRAARSALERIEAKLAAVAKANAGVLAAEEAARLEDSRVGFSRAAKALADLAIDERGRISVQTSKASDVVNLVLTKSHKIVKADQEERYVLGIVLEPLKEMGSADSQGDTYSAEEVRKAAYLFMEEFGNIGEQHQAYVNGRVKIRENWVTRDDCYIENQAVHKGTWLLGVHVVDDRLWEDVKVGRFTGFSIGGWANTRPL